MKIHVLSQPPGVEMVHLAGELDFNTSPDIRRQFAKLTEKKEPRVLVNLAKVEYIDSSGLATFIELFKKIKQLGGKLVLFDLQQAVRSVFEIAKLDSLFSLAQNEEEALALIGL